jgi:aspartate carbamoyltransferase catalytic subunit
MPKHLVYSQDLSKDEYEEIIRRFEYFMHHGISPDLCRGKIVATLFFQPSTRTMNMFQSAMLRAGGGWVGVMGEKGLSMEKGESWEDTIREYSGFANCIVLRHPADDAAERAAKVATVPVINGGSGSREHGVAAVSLLCGLKHWLKRPLQGLKVGIYGTPEINRVCKAIVPIFGYYGMNVVLDDLGHFPLPKEIEERAKANGLKSLRYDKLDNFISEVDVLFATRGLQKGIFPEGKFPKEKEEMILKLYKPINTDHMKKLRKDAYLYMITPCIFEVEPAVFPDPRCIHTKPQPWSEKALAVMTYLLGIPV